MALDPTERALRLLSLLQAHRHWQGAELTAALGVSARTLRRDVDRLRGLGYPIDSTTGTEGGYRLAAGSSLPPLLLDDDEVVAIAVAVRLSAAAAVAGIEDIAPAALAKLEQLLPDRLRRRVEAVAGGVVAAPVVGDAAEGAVDAGLLGVVALACRDAERLRFRYRRGDGEVGRRDVEPHGLAAVDRRWYLVAWDRGREGWRTFRLDRVDEVQPQGLRFPPRAVPGGDAAAFVARAQSRMPVAHEVVVRVAAPAAVVRRVVSWEALDLVDEGGGGEGGGGGGWVRVRLRDSSARWLALKVAALATAGAVSLEGTSGDGAGAAVEELAARLAAAGGGPAGRSG